MFKIIFNTFSQFFDWRKSVVKSLYITDIHCDDDMDYVVKYISDFDLDEFSYLYIMGDFWDKLVTLSSKVGLESMQLLIDIGIICANNNIKLRVLEGTSSHDRKQMKMFKLLFDNNLLGDLDFLYVSEISIINEEDHTVLYIPDNVSHGSNKTLGIVKDLMEQLGLESIDKAVIHGGFKHNLGHDQFNIHDQDEYLLIVDGFILAGHVHKFSVYKERLITVGSLNRLQFNEEDKKGGVVTVENFSTGDSDFIFVENKYASAYKTIDIYDESRADIIAILRKLVKELPFGSNVRLRMMTTNDTYMSFEEFPSINITIKLFEENHLDELVDDNPERVKVIDGSNIVNLIIDKLSDTVSQDIKIKIVERITND